MQLGRRIALGTFGTLATAGFALMAPQVAHADGGDSGKWESIAQCESGGNWSTDTGNGYSGGLQFDQGTWKANGGSGSPANASKSEQIRVAQNVEQSQGMGAWPECSQKADTSGNASQQNTQANNQNQQRNKQAQQGVQQEQPQQKPQQQPHHKGQQQQAQREAAAQQDQQVTQHNKQTDQGAKQQHQKARQQAPQKQRHAAPQSQSTSGTQYTVKHGDTLNSIAQSHNVSGGWHTLYQANQSTISNPNSIHEGQVLTLPR